MWLLLRENIRIALDRQKSAFAYNINYSNYRNWYYRLSRYSKCGNSSKKHPIK